MEQEPYLEEEDKDQLCKKDCKSIAGSLIFYYVLLFACAFTLGIISSAYIMSGASQTELETITNIFSMIATCFVTILTLVIYKKKLHVTIPHSLCKEWNFLSILRYTIIGMGLSGAAGILIQLINQILCARKLDKETEVKEKLAQYLRQEQYVNEMFVIEKEPER